MQISWHSQAKEKTPKPKILQFNRIWTLGIRIFNKLPTGIRLDHTFGITNLKSLKTSFLTIILVSLKPSATTMEKVCILEI